MAEKQLGKAGMLVALAFAAVSFVGGKEKLDDYLTKVFPVTPYQYEAYEEPRFNIPAKTDRDLLFVNTTSDPYLLQIDGSDYMVEGNSYRTPGVNFGIKIDASKFPNFKPVKFANLKKQEKNYHNEFEIPQNSSNDIFSVRFTEADALSHERENIANIGKPYTDEELEKMLKESLNKR